MTEVYKAVQFNSPPIPPPEWTPPSIRDVTDALWIEAIDPGETTGVCLAAVPYDCIFGDAPSSFLYRETFELTGSLHRQVKDACWYSRQIYMHCQSARTARPVLILCEDYDLAMNRITGAASEADVIIPVRWGAALRYAVECGHADRNRLIFQGRTMAFQTATDARLRKWDMWDVGSHHCRDATRHMIVALRRLRSGSIDPREVWA